MNNEKPSIDFAFGDRGVRLIHKDDGLYAQTLIFGKRQRYFSFMNGVKILWGYFFTSYPIERDIVVKEQKII